MARDTKRISRMVKLIHKIWKKYPDIRLGQMLMNAAKDFGYYTEDSKLEEALVALYFSKKPKEEKKHGVKKTV